jgi:hypothetical protein
MARSNPDCPSLQAIENQLRAFVVGLLEREVLAVDLARIVSAQAAAPLEQGN